MGSAFQQRLKDYLVSEFCQIVHPVDPFDESHQVKLADIEDVIDALVELLRSQTRVAGTETLWRDVQASFETLWSAKDAGVRVMAARSLATKLEPFLRKLYARRYPEAPIPDSLARLLREIAGYQDQFLHKPTDKGLLEALKQQRTEEAILHDAYHARHLSAHKARSLSLFEEARYWYSVVAAFLLIARRNMDLVAKVRVRQERIARIRAGLELCLIKARSGFDDARWRNEYYVPLNTQNDEKLDERVAAFLQSQTHRLLVVAGRTGVGKSTFLERLVVELADQAINALNLGSLNQLLVPVHLELKRYVPSRRTYLVKKLYNEFDPDSVLGIRTRSVACWPQILSPSRLVVCLDGLDEVPVETYPGVVSEIEELIADFENTQVIVTSRPHAVPNHWHGALTLIRPLSRDEVIGYFGHPGRLDLLAPDVQTFLESRPDLVDILRVPLMTEAACHYWRQFEPPDPDARDKALLEGPLLDHLYQCFFTHHLRRAFGKHIADYEKARVIGALAGLALKMDGDPLATFQLATKVLEEFERGGVKKEGLLEVFVDIGLLKPEDGQIAFLNDTVKAYFGAVGLRSRLQTRRGPEGVLSLIRQVNRFWCHCVKILKQIAPLDDLSPIEAHLTSLAEVRPHLEEVCP
ncbi:MAG TPA: NACHT domain-containing protein [Anaerolineae bacterium]|nr:NACHT domain-containing protein [Anaerolineae bacterium]